MRLYLNERPRTFVISSKNYALIIRHPFPKYKNSSSHHSHGHLVSGNPKLTSSGQKGSVPQSNKIIVEFVSLDLLNLSTYKDITPSKTRLNKQLMGFIGLLNVKSKFYLGFITSSETVASPKLDEKIDVITGVEFYCLNNDEHDYLYKSDNSSQLQLSQQQTVTNGERMTSEYPASSVRKLLSLGCFYYSTDFDISSNIQERGFLESGDDFRLMAGSPYATRFAWNSYLIAELIEFRDKLSPFEKSLFDETGFLTVVTRGNAQTVNTKIHKDEDALLTIISKQSCAKKGPLFGDWGCDDDGSVSNFVETEVIIYTNNFCFGYVIVRGNVPIFWERESHKSLVSTKRSSKVVFPRSLEASQHAFTRHFEKLINHFGDVHIINTLSDDSKSYKGQLNDKFKEHIKLFNETKGQNSEAVETLSTYQLNSTNLPISTSIMKRIGYTGTNPYDIVPVLVDPIIDFGALFYDVKKKNYRGKQLGVFRVNSFDGLSKANFISKIICQEVIELAFRDIGLHVDHDLYYKHAKLWAENDEILGKITLNFVSTSSKLQSSSATSIKSSVKSHFTKKYLSSVVDPKPNETAMLKLLGRLQDQVGFTIHNPVHDFVTKEINKRSKEYRSSKDITVFSSTFNVNGATHDKSIKEWLFPSAHKATKSYDLVFVGFQEIVELSPGQMVNTDSMNKVFWEKKIKTTLDKYNPQKYKYVSLWTGQIGGIALMLFIQDREIDYISNVEGCVKKTGLGGMSANKGGVAVSFYYCTTQICLVSAHLAAGLANIEERHQNYKTLIKGIKFSKNRRIKDHDVVIWLGDFNFRIGLLNEQVKPLIEQKQYNKLFEYDQLNRQMANGETFPFFDEMEIKFPPTYKFDHGTLDYDTSEKQRIPAWTDRILSMSRRKKLVQEFYDCIEEIDFSDHRPVVALFRITVDIIDENVKRNIAVGIYENYRKNMGGDINDLFITNNNLSFLTNELDERDLPPPSSEIHKWWLEGGYPAKIQIQQLAENSDTGEGSRMIINPRLPNNPFSLTMEPEFITQDRLTTLLSKI